jgi:thiosulfate/3-mercaptopyruvate sulfurtransferase
MHPLVTPAWLADRLDEPNVVIVDATLPPVGAGSSLDPHAQYLAAHIPGAVFFDIDELSDHATTLPHMLPEPGAFSRSMSALGISDSMTIVVYEQAAVFSAPRAWWMLRTFGAQNVYLLDGGLQAWLTAGFATQSGNVLRPPATFSARLDRAAVKSFAQVQHKIAEHEQILDARSAGRFSGALPEPRPQIPSGHMPGAINIPFTELLAANHLKSAKELRQFFTERSINLDQPITTTCGSGVTAAILSLALELAGATDVSLYDGSWSEYAQRPDAAVEPRNENAAS